jgi:hypothetical protein
MQNKWSHNWRQRRCRLDNTAAGIYTDTLELYEMNTSQPIQKRKKARASRTVVDFAD